jgi:hypothetical protein
VREEASERRGEGEKKQVREAAQKTTNGGELQKRRKVVGTRRDRVQCHVV